MVWSTLQSMQRLKFPALIPVQPHCVIFLNIAVVTAPYLVSQMELVRGFVTIARDVRGCETIARDVRGCETIARDVRGCVTNRNESFRILIRVHIGYRFLHHYDRDPISVYSELDVECNKNNSF